MYIGIAGFGFVGQAVYSGLAKPEYAALYDPYKELNDFEELTRTSAIFACLPTPMWSTGAQDSTAYEEFFASLIEKEYKGIVVVKSTILYSNLEPYLKDLNIVFNPEFLCQNTAVDDFRNQRYIVLGGRIDLCQKVARAYKEDFILDTCPEFEYCTIEEAVNIKYIHNVYHAYKVLFWNYANEVTGNSRKMALMYKKIREGNPIEMDRIAADGRLGYGGACFVKDVNAYKHEHPHKLVNFMKAYNYELRQDEP